MIKNADEIKRIKAALNRGRLQRNIKTAIIVLAATSGALVSQPVLAVTATGTLISLLLANMIKSKQSRDNQSIS
jgi:hypothetical protein